SAHIKYLLILPPPPYSAKFRDEIPGEKSENHEKLSLNLQSDSQLAVKAFHLKSILTLVPATAI
ncbi:MAG: hypothetical protein ACYSUD_17430, partial [Planctomycetota bacterium]